MKTAIHEAAKYSDQDSALDSHHAEYSEIVLTCSISSCQSSRRQTIESDLVLVDCGRVVRDEIDARYLLEHLIDIGQYRTVQVSIFALSQILESALPFGRNLGNRKIC